jgi:putative SOS response-associated peptidase YedK
MTTDPNGIVAPIHEKAMPVMLMAPEDVDQWLRGSSVEDALKNAEASVGRCDCDSARGKEGSRASRKIYFD